MIQAAIIVALLILIGWGLKVALVALAPYWWIGYVVLVPIGFWRNFMAERTVEWQELFANPPRAPVQLLGVDETIKAVGKVRALRQDEKRNKKELDVLCDRYGYPRTRVDGEIDRRGTNSVFFLDHWERWSKLAGAVKEAEIEVLLLKQHIEQRKNIWIKAVVRARSARESLTACLLASSAGLCLYFVQMTGTNYESLWPGILATVAAICTYALAQHVSRKLAASEAAKSLKELVDSQASNFADYVNENERDIKSDDADDREYDDESGDGNCDEQAESSTSHEKKSEEGKRESSKIKTWWSVLGVSRSASEEDIKAAYRSLMHQYHPDKVAALGPELRELAERKSTEINAAYEEAKKAT